MAQTEPPTRTSGPASPLSPPPSASRAAQPTLRTDGFTVVRGFLSPDELRVLRRECDALAAATTTAALVDQGCVLDVLAQCPMRDDAAARVDSSAYLAARSAQLAALAPATDPAQSLDRVDVDAVSADVVGHLLFHRLPTTIAELLGARDRRLFFFNEHFVVKPPASAVEFRWHRDEDEQLAMCVHRAAIPPYVSAWCALDAVTSASGPLRFLPPGSAAAAIGALDASRHSPGLEPCRGLVEEALDAEATPPVTAAAGDVLVFRSDVWHASAANASRVPRRALYAQFSREEVTAGPSDPSPLSFAIPCPGPHIAAKDISTAGDMNKKNNKKRRRVWSSSG